MNELHCNKKIFNNVILYIYLDINIQRVTYFHMFYKKLFIYGAHLSYHLMQRTAL